uniref:GPI ethanolamine phosphate transferase 1 n=1 Tax=Acrobeloides nanus TaxID=290746 RepID=A0A914ECD5_9BILA
MEKAHGGYLKAMCRQSLALAMWLCLLDSMKIVFNQSRFSWLWGSPDIVPMFGDGLSHVFIDAYSHEEEDFASKDAAQLDKWVFEKVKKYFQQSTHSSNAKELLKEDKVVFFLHLLGLDTNGHGNKPHSKEYIDNILVVDEGIKEIVELFENFYGDNRTAYLFTADHGMTDWGSHGAGSDDEIETPFVAWGSSIAQSKLKRVVNQVDLAPLMSSLIGIAIPMNSVGILRLELLDMQSKMKYQAACSNLKQMVEQYSIKREERKRTALPMMFREYKGFAPVILQRVNSEVSRLVDSRRFDAAAALCLEWIPRARDALIYFHRYHRVLLRIREPT